MCGAIGIDGGTGAAGLGGIAGVGAEGIGAEASDEPETGLEGMAIDCIGDAAGAEGIGAGAGACVGVGAGTGVGTGFGIADGPDGIPVNCGVRPPLPLLPPLLALRLLLRLLFVVSFIYQNYTTEKKYSPYLFPHVAVFPIAS